MNEAFTKTSFIVIVAYIAAVAVCVFAFRPTDVQFPSFIFFLIYCSLPCLGSLFLVLSAHSKAVVQKVMRFIAAIALFFTVWLIQLWLLVQYAVTQPNEHLEGLLSNFYVFSHIFLVRGLVADVVVLGLIMLLGNIVVHRNAKA